MTQTRHSPRAYSVPSLWTIFYTWFLLGIQSFGGGSSTFLLIHRTTTTRKWLTEEEFIRAWALSQISPGINLLKLTVLVGYKLRGWRGVAAGMLGMLLPSGIVTVLMTAGFSAIRGQPLVQSAMRGILPATVGLSVAMGIQMALPLVKRAYHTSPRLLTLYLTLIATATLLLYNKLVSPLIILILTGGVMIFLGRLKAPSEPSPDDPSGNPLNTPRP